MSDGEGKERQPETFGAEPETEIPVEPQQPEFPRPDWTVNFPHPGHSEPEFPEPDYTLDAEYVRDARDIEILDTDKSSGE